MIVLRASGSNSRALRGYSLSLLDPPEPDNVENTRFSYHTGTAGFTESKTKD